MYQVSQEVKMYSLDDEIINSISDGLYQYRVERVVDSLIWSIVNLCKYGKKVGIVKECKIRVSFYVPYSCFGMIREGKRTIYWPHKTNHTLFIPPRTIPYIVPDEGMDIQTYPAYHGKGKSGVTV